MMVALQAAGWPPAQVQDTINRIVARGAYQRDLGETLLGRLVRWFFHQLDRMIEGAANALGTREVVYGILLVLAVLLLIRLVLDLRAEFDGQSLARSRRTGARVSDPWGEAERLAQAGRYTDAAHALFGALLGALGARGELRVHASKTAGDYARELKRRNAPSAPRFQSFRGRYDRAIYGDGEVSAEGYRALLDDAKPLIRPERGS
ncbi:MAG: DUF4129 domain-containing protein [Gemmatimonadetes bacterium]|nr:DUF4129 domain-containing protein [Gemmatimonadota bacterium]